MVAPIIIAAIIVAIVALIAMLAFTAWLNLHTGACMNDLNEILTFTTSIREDPDNTNVWCSEVKIAITSFENLCSEFSAPAYESYIPPCK